MKEEQLELDSEAAAWQQVDNNTEELHIEEVINEERRNWEFNFRFNEMCEAVTRLPCHIFGTVQNEQHLAQHLLWVMQEARRNRWNISKLLTDRLENED